MAGDERAVVAFNFNSGWGKARLPLGLANASSVTELRLVYIRRRGR